jgi:hypothetical protein
MSTLSLSLPTSFHRELRELARLEGVSINQIISSAVGEKLATLKTLDYLRERAARGSRASFERVLLKAADTEPMATDRLANHALEPTAPRRRKRRGSARQR